MKSIQCLKALYLYKNYYHLKDPVPKERQKLFDRGHKVGFAARELFPGGVDASPVSPFKYDESVELTKRYIADGKEVIYEACFVHEGVMVAVDILVKGKSGWEVFEVKSSAKISQTYVMDACLQYYVVSANLDVVHDFSLVTINTGYQRKGTIVPEELFRFTSIKEDALKNIPFFRNKIQIALRIAAGSEMPDVKIGEQCYQPYECDFVGTCWKNCPKPNIFQLSGLGSEQRKELIANGQFAINSLSLNNNFNNSISVQVRSYQNQEVELKLDEIKKFYSSISTNEIGFLDIEVMATAIPCFDGIPPFTQIPFLFSFLKLSNGDTVSKTYIAQPNGDPRESFAQALLAYTNGSYPIIAYDSGLEKNVIGQLSRLFPELKKQCEGLSARIIDLSVIFKNYWYFHPGFLGKMDLKTVSQTILGNSVFDGLDVQSGMLASYMFEDLYYETNPFIVQERCEQLSAYCESDTRATYELYNYFKKLIG